MTALTFFIATTIFALLFIAWKEKSIKSLSISEALKSLKTPLALSLPVIAIICLGQYFSQDQFMLCIYSSVLPFVFSLIVTTLCLSNGMSTRLNRLLLLLVTATTAALCKDITSYIPAIIFGISCAKLCALLFADHIQQDDKAKLQVDDIQPTLIIFTGILWLNSIYSAPLNSTYINLLYCAVSATVLQELVHTPFLKNDSWYLKRIILAISGGLFYLIAITKILGLPKFDNMALALAVGFLVTYLIKDHPSIEKEKHEEPRLPIHEERPEPEFTEKLQTALMQLSLIGLATLAASRLLGMFGLLIFACATIIGAPASLLGAVGLFLSGRVLLQTFINDYNLNLSGINICHTYSSAAIYGGIAIILLIGAILTNKDKVKAAGFLTTVTILLTAPLANFFLHAEASSSLYFALLACGIVSAVLGKLFTKQKNTTLAYVITLLPLCTIAYATLIPNLLSLGANAILQVKLYVLAGAMAAIYASAVLYKKLLVKKQH